MNGLVEGPPLVGGLGPGPPLNPALVRTRPRTDVDQPEFFDQRTDADLCFWKI